MNAMRLYEADECGKDGYPPEWHERIKHEARALAGDRCIRCMHPYKSRTGEWSPCDDRCRHGGPVRYWLLGESDWTHYDGEDLTIVGPVDSLQARWRILTVHHLDGNKANCRWMNLAALCQRCHLQIQGKVQMARVWPWEHSSWMKPYVAGYYALTYLGEELTREQTMERLDELLGLERVA